MAEFHIPFFVKYACHSTDSDQTHNRSKELHGDLGHQWRAKCGPSFFSTRPENWF